MELSSDKLDNNKSNQDKFSFDEEKRMIIDIKNKKGIYNSLRDNKRGI